MKIADMVLIEWHDAKICTGIYTKEDILGKLRMSLFKSPGYLISQEKTTTILASEENDQGEYRDITLIPTGSIISIKRLTVGKKLC